MPTIADAYVQIIPSAEGISGKISSALNSEAENAGASSGGKFSSAFSSGLKKLGKGTAMAIGAATTGIAALTKASVSGYAEMEQLVGGVETLFGTGGKSLEEYAKSVGMTTDKAEGSYKFLEQAQSEVLANASKAYKTAGMSANQYMETVTSFSASLIASLGGDTVVAAKAADQAIIDMSDNANKMGTDIQSIQNAYQGFAKQNYTMLDNLKLGYGGTKEEMQRLLADAEELSGVHYELGEFADMAEAIHVIQTEMGITGTTAKEASTTISGSIQSMSAAWSNLVTGMADKNADVPGLVNQFVESVGTVATNILPVVEQALVGVGTLIEQLVPEIMNRIPTFISETLPSLIESGISVVEAIITGIQENAEQLGSSAAEIISMLVVAISDMGPDLLDAALIIIESLASGLAENLDTIIPAVTSMILEIANVLVSHVDDIIAVGFQLFSSLIQGILQALPVIIQQLPFLLEGLINGCMSHLPEIVQMWVDLMSCLGEALPDIVDSLLQVLPELLVQIIEYWTGPGAAQLLSAALKMWEALTKALVMIVARVIAGIGTLVRNIGSEIGGAAGKVLSSAKKMFEGLFTAAKDIMTKVKTGISDGFNTVISFIKGLGSKMAEAGKNLITGLWNGIKGAFDGVVEKVKKLVEKLPTAVKKVLGIKSPSTVFAEIGGYLAEGLGVGWEDSIKKVNAEIGKDLNYKGNIEVDSTFKDDFSEGMKVAANSLGNSVPVAAQPDETNLSGATIIINDRITLDGTPLKDVVAEYTIKKMGNDVRAMKVSRGGSNVL